MRPLICGRWWMVSGAWSFRVVKMVSCLAEISEIFRIQKLQDWMFWQCVMNLKRTVLSEIQDFGWWLCCSQGKKRRLVDGWLLQMKTWELAQDNTIFAWFLCRWRCSSRWSPVVVSCCRPPVVRLQEKRMLPHATVGETQLATWWKCKEI